MSIRLETSQRSGIPNHQDTEISKFHLNWSKQIKTMHLKAIERTKPSPLYNCHGFTFACRRTRVETNLSIQTILMDDKYEEVRLEHVLAGDIVIYYSDEGDS